MKTRVERKTLLPEVNKYNATKIEGKISKNESGSDDILLGDGEIRNELLNEENFNKGNIKSVFEPCPEVEVDVYGTKVKCIVDSGSETNIISKRLFN